MPSSLICKYDIILGSKSPRRRELLAGLDIPFRVVDIAADESYPNDLVGGDIPIYISRAKATAYTSLLTDGELLITADTIVWSMGKMLGKPTNEQEAYEMLRQLSGHTHQVFTGVTLTKKSNGDIQMDSFVDKTDVTFDSLSEDEIRYYVDRYKPLDKAGGYGIQEYIGFIGVSHLSGSYFNVMGFPVERVYGKLRKYILYEH